ncbi:MAG: glutamyl-tRNA reductase, partial [Candidatus Paceibacteria bacterium]
GFFNDEADTPAEARRELQAWEGEGAVEHLFLVAMGLDSVRLGETEILSQVRLALEESRALGLSGKRLDPIFDESLKLAKRARHETDLGLGRTSLAEIGLDQVRAEIARRPGPLALIGISAMTERCARALCQEGHDVWLVNRTTATAETLAKELGERALVMPLDSFRAAPPPIAALMSATGAAGPIFNADQLARLRTKLEPQRRPLLVDFATDPDLDPRLAKELGFDLLDMQEMLAIAERSRQERLAQCGEARSLVDQALERMTAKLGRQSADKAIGALRKVWLRKTEQELESLITKHFEGLEIEKTEALRRFASKLSNRFAHIPAAGLRNLAETHGVDLVREFFKNTDEELAEEVEDSLDPAYPFQDSGIRNVK